jgi:ArsR family transcriptional regulator
MPTALITSEAVLARRFKALGHPVRLGIVARLAEEPGTCACDFAEVFGIAQPTVSEHLRVLREAGLAVTERRGTQICYSLAPAAFEALRELVDAVTR